LVILALAAPRQSVRLALIAAAASVAGGAAMYALAGHGVTLPAPLTTARMHAVAATDVYNQGPAAMHGQPMSGIPYKVYGAAEGRAHAGLLPFLVASATARGLRILIVGLVAGLVGAASSRWRRWYPVLIGLFVTVFSAGLAAVVESWS
jgi:membrane protein YqaA with SNARE-associated domain